MADGYTVSKRDESNLWRDTMTRYYGPEWPLLAMSAGLEADQPQASRPSEPGGAPATGAGLGLPRPQPGSDAPSSQRAGTGSPGSGIPLDPAASAPPRSATPPSRVDTEHASPTPLSSADGDGLGTPSKIIRRVARGIKPDQESEEPYKQRLSRLSNALRVAGGPMRRRHGTRA